MNAKEAKLAAERLALEQKKLEQKLLAEEEQRLQEIKVFAVTCFSQLRNHP